VKKPKTCSLEDALREIAGTVMPRSAVAALAGPIGSRPCSPSSVRTILPRKPSSRLSISTRGRATEGPPGPRIARPMKYTKINGTRNSQM
jgi:hypothetical protein